MLNNKSGYSSAAISNKHALISDETAANAASLLASNSVHENLITLVTYIATRNYTALNAIHPYIKPALVVNGLLRVNK